MDTNISIAIVGLLGGAIGAILTYVTQVKDLKIKAQSEERQKFDSVMSQQEHMYNNLQEEVTRLQSRVDYLEKENHQLLAVLSHHGIEVINTECCA